MPDLSTLILFSIAATALLVGTIGGWLPGNAGFLRAQRYTTGGVFLALGVATALTGSERK